MLSVLCTAAEIFMFFAQLMLSLLLMSSRSVVACEAAVRKHYVLLGWEYKETDSDDDNNVTGCGKMHFIESV